MFSGDTMRKGNARNGIAKIGRKQHGYNRIKI
jgi:hypothetical protein